MTNEQLKELEDKLWDSANSLRAYGGIKASDYAVPVLGLIFLKFADNKYSRFEEKIKAEYEKAKGTRMERPIEEIALAKCGLYLVPNARYDYLLNLPGKLSMAKALRDAMESIEQFQDTKFQDVLPKEAYFSIEKKKDDILPQLLKTFSDIPKDATGDVFGKIYEYFLGKFALSEGQKGGEFFTPTSVVRFIVEVIEPYKGKIFDPACGSAGMFVQSANFVQHENHDLNDIYVCGQEFMGETVRLAKMNLLVNSIRGDIYEVNSYQEDPFNSYGKFDFVMANPPFNVKSVKESTVKNDRRFYEYGLPKNKGKKDDKISDANYLWISLFATSLNEKGRAGFVMANSASDARNAEYEIRKKIVDSGIVDCMVSMPSNMFFTVTLPATLWFFDKQKVNTDRKDKILFIDARNVYRQIDRAHREWTEEQQQNLAAIVRLYRGEKGRYLELVASYLDNATKSYKKVAPARQKLRDEMAAILQGLIAYSESAKNEQPPAKQKKLAEVGFFKKLEELQFQESMENELSVSGRLQGNTEQIETGKKLESWVKNEKEISESLKSKVNILTELWKLADKDLKQKNDKNWSANGLDRADKNLDGLLQEYAKAKENTDYWYENIHWLQKRFPDAEYKDIIGLCKAVDKNDYAVEHDYSLNAGRYVGVELEMDTFTESEYKEKILSLNNEFKDLCESSLKLERQIVEQINSIF